MHSGDSLNILIGLPRQLAGHLAVTALKIIQSLPPQAMASAFGLWLPLYPRFRWKHTRRIKQCITESPFHSKLNLKLYYAMRLRLFLLGLQQHGKPLRPDSVIIKGMEHYQAALASGKPIVLLGIHMGLFELLHRIPEASKGREFFILTAPAFAPALTNFMAQGRMKDGKEILWNQQRNPYISIGDSFSTGLKTFLRNRGILAMMVDQNPGPTKNNEKLCLWNSIQVAYPKRMLARLTQYGVCFIPVSTVLQADGKARLNFHSEIGADVETELQRFLELEISTAPEQWNWSYPKILPKGI